MKYIKDLLSNDVRPIEETNRKIAYEIATEGIVVLENDGTLPIDIGEIGLFGSGARKTIKGGTGSGEVNERHSVSIYEGLKNAGFTISTDKWLDDYDSEYEQAIENWKKGVRKGVVKAIFGDLSSITSGPIVPSGRPIEKSDRKASSKVGIYVISRQSGEGADRKINLEENDLSAVEIGNIKFLTENYEKTILVINSGCSLNLNTINGIKGINAIVFYCQQGEEGGNAFADIISGKVNPSGKLTSTWANNYNDIPFANEYSYNNGDLKEEYYKEGIFVGYRYFDSFKVAPRYPFGFGLSYTSFKFDESLVTSKDTLIRAAVEVENVGSRSGKEVAELYLTSPEGSATKEYQSLVGFAKTKLLEPKEKTRVEIEFDLKDFAYYDIQNGEYHLDAGDYLLRLGNSSRNSEVIAVITLDQTVIVSKHANLLPSKGKIMELEAPKRDEEIIPMKAQKIAIFSKDIITKGYVYRTPEIYSDPLVDEIMKKLSINDMIHVVVGAGFFGANPAFMVPGAVGNTTSLLLDKGIENVVLSDGPAGIRIQRVSALTKSGKVKPIEFMFSMFNCFPNFIKKAMSGNLKKDTILYQNCTAFPVGMSIAQTWNKELETKFGAAVSSEMSEYGITFWLAPGMNICRNPLCGRNFEYYSEDPVASGKTASNVIEGLESIPGNYATIKHFFCNNQEDNRNFTDANVDERTLREIYLKNFMFPVRDAKVHAVMTSYNKVNGVYTANREDVIEGVLRNEWGFNGVVMTDWFATNKGQADVPLCIKAGNDMQMPGGTQFEKAMLKGLRKGVFTETDLKRAAANVIRSIVHSHMHEEVSSKLFK